LAAKTKNQKPYLISNQTPLSSDEGDAAKINRAVKAGA